MSTFQGRTPSGTYGDLLHIENSNAGFDTSLRGVEDGKGGASPFRIATDRGGFLNPTNRQTDDYVLVIGDAFKLVELNKATAINITVPPNSSVAFELYTSINVAQYGAGQVTFVAGSGVTIRSSSGVLTSPSQYAICVLLKIATNEWYLVNGSPGQDLSGYVPTTRTVNAQALSANVVVPNQHFYRRDGQGIYYSNNVGSATSVTITHTANTLRAWPWFVGKAMTIDSVISEVTTLQAASSYRLGIYTSNADGGLYPDALVANSDIQTYDSTTTGIKTGTPGSNIVLTPGLYWIAFNTNAGINMRCHPVTGLASVLGVGSALGGSSHGVGWSVAFTYAAMPANFPGSATVLAASTTASACPIMGCRGV